MSDESTKEYKLIKEKREEMQPIFDRMDEDEKLYLLDPYKLKKLPPFDNKEENDVANVTLPGPLRFATKVMQIIGAAKRQTVVEGEKLSDKQATKIEEFSDDIFYMVNEWLNKRGITSLDSKINEQIAIRGRIVGSSMVRLDKEGNLIPAVLPREARYFVYENDENGMVWGAPIMTRSKAKIESEYGITITGKSAEVIDFWNSEKEEVFIDAKVAKEQVNPHKYPPFVVSISPGGSMLDTDEAFKHQGEGIFWPNRGMWPEKNRIATIVQTLTQQALFASMQLEVSNTENAAKPEEWPGGVDKVNLVEKGMGYKPMPISDIKAATRLAYSIIEAETQRSSLTALDYGNLTFPLSAIAYTEITSGRNDTLMPLVQAIATWYQAITRMIISQCMAYGKQIKIGQPGNQRTYSVSDLRGDYEIQYRFFTQSKEQTIADLSIAKTARGFLPDDYILRELMKVQDPDGLMTQLKSQQAEMTDEVLFLYRRACALIDEAETLQGKERQRKQFEASLLGQRIATILKQRQAMGSLSSMEGKGEAKTEPSSKELMPLMAGGRGGRGGVSDLERAVETEEAESVE